jgi:repressor LexA
MNMLSEKLKTMRTNKGLTQLDIANLLGVTQQAVGKWERGLSAPDYDALVKLSNLYHVSTDYLLGQKSKEFSNKLEYARALLAELEKEEQQEPVIHAGYKIPVLGSVAAGQPIFADGNVVGYEYIESKYQNDGYKYYALRIKGESMTPTIMDGDTVIVRQQFSCENGQIAIVLVDCGMQRQKKCAYKTMVLRL